MTNKLIQFLKKNKEGAIIGGVISAFAPTLVQINIRILSGIGAETFSSPLLSIVISFFIGALIGAWIQSRFF